MSMTPFFRNLSAGLIVFLAGLPAMAADIRVRATGAVQHTLVELAEAFHTQTGHTVKAEFGTAGAVVAQFAAGAPLAGGPADLVFSSAGSLAAPEVRARLMPDAPRVVGRVRIGIGVKAGDKAPDISTPEMLKAALLAAPSFAYADPATGATTGIHFARMLEAMGIAEAVRAKAVLRNGGLIVMKEVAEGKAAFGFTQASEIKAVPGVVFAAFLPDQMQLVSAYAGAVARDAPQAEAATAFLAYVSGPAGQAAFTKAGFDPPQ